MGYNRPDVKWVIIGRMVEWVIIGRMVKCEPIYSDVFHQQLFQGWWKTQELTGFLELFGRMVENPRVENLYIYIYITLYIYMYICIFLYVIR